MLLGGKLLKSCTVFSVQANGVNLQTIEGVSESGKTHSIAEAFREKHWLQSGYCAPGMSMTAKSQLSKNPNPTELEVGQGISGNNMAIVRSPYSHAKINFINASKALVMEGVVWWPITTRCVSTNRCT